MEQKENKLEPGAAYSSSENFVTETADLLELSKLTDNSENNGSSVAATRQFDRAVIWQGIVEWVEKIGSTRRTLQVPCSVESLVKDGETEVKGESWPMKLIMQLMPKVLLGNVGLDYLKNSKSVVFFMSQCEALESLIKVMSNRFAGCVHFTDTATCNIKVLMLLYSSEKQIFLGFIPNDQQGVIGSLRNVINEQKLRWSERQQ